MGTGYPVGMTQEDGLSPETRRRLRDVAQRAANAARERDELIVVARAEGATLREIGAAVGLTHGGVRKVLERVSQ